MITCSTTKHFHFSQLVCFSKPFPSYRRFLTPLQQTAFRKPSDKRRNCSKLAISPYSTMFTTFSHRLSIQLWRFSIFRQNMFKVVCCIIVVWGKGLMTAKALIRVHHLPYQPEPVILWCNFHTNQLSSDVTSIPTSYPLM